MHCSHADQCAIMIESYFIKSRKRKADDDRSQMCDKQQKTENQEENYEEKNKLDLSQCMIPDDASTLLPQVSDLKWKAIRAENLNLSYAIMFSPGNAWKIFNQLEKEIVYDKNSKVQVFGKWYKVPRQQASYGDVGMTYSFSGTSVSAKQWTPLLRQLRDLLVNLTGNIFNFVLVNRYNDGNDHMGEHKDDEQELVQESAIASLSFGEARDFIFRHQDARGARAKKKIDPVRIQLQSGSLLLMHFPTNSYWYHSLPVRKRCLGPRINLTFRHMHS